MSETIKYGAEEYNVTEFYLNFLHDLRAELTIVGGYASLIKEETAEGQIEDIKENADHISQSYKKMIDAINNVNDLIRIESGLIQFKKEDVDIRKILNELLAEKKSVIQEKQISIEADFKEDTMLVTGDTESFKKAFNHLIDASISFSPMGSRIHIVAFKKEKMWYGYIQDNGPGIPMDEVPKLFKPFQNIHALEYLGENKVGLQLLISKEVINHSGGKLYAESQADKGVKLIFEVPVKKEIEMKKVLIIEDNITIAKMWEAKLKKSYAVSIASNGLEGIKKAQSDVPDIVILDVLMPGMDGFETCKLLKEKPEMSNVPVIFLSNIMQEHLKEKAKTVGAIDFLNKSTVSPSDLGNKIDEIIKAYYPEKT